MNKSLAEPKMLASSILVLLLAALALIPARALAAPEGGESLPLLVAPSPVEIEKTTVGLQSPTVEAAISNPGEEVAAIEKIVLEGEDASQFYFQGSSCGSLYQGQSCSIWIGFSPTSAGLKQATVRIQFSGGTRADETFQVSATAVLPQLSFQPGGHDFGTQWIYRGEEFGLELKNSGEAPVQINGFDTIGPDAHSFWINNNSCWSNPGGWLAPGLSCFLQVVFQPGEIRSYEAQARVSVNGAAFTADLLGRGGRAIVEADANPSDFGAITVGSAGDVRAITMTNVGDLPASFFIGVIAGGDAGSFELVDEDCSGEPVGPGATCVAHVRFQPQGVGPKLARLALFGDDDGGTMVMLKGEGLAPNVSMTPASFDFGPQASDTRGPAHAFTIRNDGQGSIAVDRVEIVGADLDQFVLTGDECTGVTLEPGAECRVRVRFGPGEEGAKRAILRVRGEAAVLTSSLSGWGEPAALAAEVPVAGGATAGAATASKAAPRRKHVRRFAHGKAINTDKRKPLRRSELRAAAARR